MFFPQLFVELISVGEESGRLTLTFAELERYFETIISARRQFAAALIYPAFIYFSGISVITILLFVLGQIAPPGAKPFDPLGLGLTGGSGALIFLSLALGLTVSVVLAFLFLRENDAIRPSLESLGLKLPFIGACLRAFALQRFSMALQMTAEAGFKADRCLDAAFRATANASYQVQGAKAAQKARQGTPIPKVLANCGRTLFPEPFQDAVAVGELTGKLPEVLEKQAERFRDEGTRRFKFLTMLAGGAVYAMVGLLIIVAIFRLAFSVGNIYQEALKGV
jgi:type II secretory pathway component PulF